MIPNSHIMLADGAANLDGLRILVVEDSWDVGTGLKMLLEAWGANIAGPVATMSDAQNLVSQQSPDVALVDINLRNGELSYDLIDWLNERGIRVVVISGYPDVSVARDKAIAVLPKPTREDLLLASLNSARKRLGVVTAIGV